MARKNIRLSPKSTFLEDSKRADAHTESMALPAFQSAAAAALLEYQVRISGNEPQSAAVRAFKLQGAQEFLTVLMNLGLPSEPKESYVAQGLVPPEEAVHRMQHPGST